MSTVESGQTAWPNISDQNLDSKYEKCRNITEEIYKRINITFQIKKLEAGQSELSDNSEQIDSNELSNETDLFACDKSELTSSTEAERPAAACGKFININNNEEKNKPAPALYRRPKKRFRKRVKKRPVRARSDSEGSSDEAPLSRIADAPHVLILAAEVGPAAAVLKPKPERRPTKKEASKKSATPKTPQKNQVPADVTDNKNIELVAKTLSVRIDKLPMQDVMLSVRDDKLSVKNYRSFMKDNKLTIKNDTPSTKHDTPSTKHDTPSTKHDTPSTKHDTPSTKHDTPSTKHDTPSTKDDTPSMKDDKLSFKTDKLSLKSDKLSMKEEKDKNAQWKSCNLCSLSFRGERGLRRHMSMSHIVTPEDCK